MTQAARRWLEGTLAAALYAAAALVYLRPIARVHGDSLAPNAEDPLFTLYVLKWVMRQARLGFPDLWNANVFFPAKGALAFSDPFLAPALQVLWVPNAISAYNLLVVSSFVLAGLAMWWVLRESGCSAPAAILGGAMFAFSPFRWSHLNHLAMLLGQWIPLAMWSFDRLLAERTPRRAALFLLFYTLNLLSSCYFAYMLIVPLLAILASRFLAHGRELVRPRALAVLAPAGVLAFVATLALFLPYLRLGRDMEMTRDESVVVHNAAALASYVSPAPENLYSPRPPRALWSRARLPLSVRPFTRVENSLFPGILATIFALVGLVAFVRRWRASPPTAGDETSSPTRDASPSASSSPANATSSAASQIGAARRIVLGALLLVALLAVLAGDVYTLRFERDTALSNWLPPASRATWWVLGTVFAASLALGAWLRRRWRGRPLLRWREIDPWERGLLISGAACLLLSFPLAYVPLMRVVPGLDGMRVPARFAALLAVTVVYFAARGLDLTFSRIHLRAARIAVIAALATFLAVELCPRPVHWVRIPRESELPEVYHWLAAQPQSGVAPGPVRALLEVPMRGGGREAPYMYAATLHWKPIANGYSSFLPPSYERLSAAVGRGLPSGEALDFVASLGVTHLVVHAERLGPPARLRQWEAQMSGRLRLVHAAGTDRVYGLAPAQREQVQPQNPP